MAQISSNTTAHSATSKLMRHIVVHAHFARKYSPTSGEARLLYKRSASVRRTPRTSGSQSASESQLGKRVGIYGLVRRYMMIRGPQPLSSIRDKNTLHGSGAMAHADPRQLLVNTPEPEDPTPAGLRWRRLVSALFRIRRLQRIWGSLGRFLQTVNSDLRRRLQAGIQNTQ